MFWDNFKEVCDMRGLKPTPVLKECKISTGSIGRWQAGSAPNSDAIIALAEYLKCSTDLLLTGKEYVSPDNYKKQCSSPEEIELLAMFRSIPDYAKEIVLGSLRAAYDAEMRRQEEEKRLLG